MPAAVIGKIVNFYSVHEEEMRQWIKAIFFRISDRNQGGCAPFLLAVRIVINLPFIVRLPWKSYPCPLSVKNRLLSSATHPHLHSCTWRRCERRQAARTAPYVVNILYALSDSVLDPFLRPVNRQKK